MSSNNILDKGRLFDFLDELDKEFSKKGRKVTLVAVGGTAMTLLDLKLSTLDVDFTVPGEDYSSVDLVLKMLSPGFKIDIWQDGAVFSQFLPQDYLVKSIKIKTDFSSLQLRALHPLDIIVTKIGRLNDRDIQDIEVCIKQFKITKKEISNRAKQVQYEGDENIYQENLKYVLKKFF
jgi:hypothetical protein